MRSFGVLVALNVITMCVLVFLSSEVNARGMVEMLSKIMRICGVDVIGAFSGNMPERACNRKEMMVSHDNHVDKHIVT